MNQNATGDASAPPSAKAAANLAAAEEVLAATAGEAQSKTAIPNNKALIDGLVGLWIPDASGSIPDNAYATFERELLRSIIYVDKTGGKPKLTQEGLLIAYTDEKSAAPKSTLVAVPAAKLIERAAKKQLGVYLHHEGKASVFTALTVDRIGEILAQADKKKK